MKKGLHNRFWLIILLLNPLASLGLGLWAFSLPGTVGLVRWDSEYRFLIGLVLSLGLWAPALWMVRHIFLRKTRVIGKVFGVGWRLLSLVVLVGTLGGWGYLFVQPMIKSGDKPPLLLVSSYTGSSVPDLVISTWTEKPQTITATLGAGTETLDRVVSQNTQIHRLVFSNLQPEKLYTYRLEDGPAVQFRSLPNIALEGSKPLRTAFAGDVHFGSKKRYVDRTQHILDRLLEQKYDLDIFSLVGDITEMGFFDSEWQLTIDTLSPVFSQIPFMPVPGNHDAVFRGYRHYLDYLHPDLGTGFEDMYRRVSVGPVHFLLLSVLSGMEDVSDAQMKWLEDQLASIPEDHWKVVVSHCFYYSSGMDFTGEPWYDHPDTIRELTPIFERYGVDLVITGHNHLMEVLAHNDVTYVVIGSMGAGLDEITYRSPASLWVQEAHGWLDVTWTMEAAELQFIQWDGQLLHTHTLHK